MFDLFKRNGEPARDGCEWAPMYVGVRIAAEDWKSAVLTRNGETLTLSHREVAGAIRVVAEWKRAGCGSYELRLVHKGREYRHRIDVLPRKLRRAAVMRMLEELEGELPTSVALALQPLGGLTGLRLLDPGEASLNEQVHRLRRAIMGTTERSGVAAVLREIARDPHRVLRSTDQWTDAKRVRRPHPALIGEALSRGYNLGPDGRPIQFLDTRAEHTLDCEENRFVSSYVLLLEQELRSVQPALRMRRVRGASLEVAALADTLRTARRQAAFLDSVGEPSAPPNLSSMVFLKRPAYRAAAGGYLEYQRRHAVRLEAHALDSPFENIPYLYQVWGTLRVIRVLTSAAATLGYTVLKQNLITRTRNGVILRVLPGGEPVLSMVHRVTGAEVHVRSQPSYRNTGEIRSATYEQKPDVAVVVRASGGETELYLFDPKYKLEGEALDAARDVKPKKIDIDKMHAYRDAIRSTGGRHVVAYAAILYPGPATQYPGAGVEALSAIPGDTEGLDRRLHAVLSPPLAAHAAAISAPHP